MDYSVITVCALIASCVLGSISLIVVFVLWRYINRRLEEMLHRTSTLSELIRSMSAERSEKTAYCGAVESASERSVHSSPKGPSVAGTVGSQCNVCVSKRDSGADSPTPTPLTSIEWTRIDLAPGLSLHVSHSWPWCVVGYRG